MRTLLFALSLVLLTGCKQSSEKNNATSTDPDPVSIYYLIRHAEKDRSDPENKDPSLTPEGERRAAFWADYFKQYSLDAVYSSDYARTRQTAMPTAAVQGLQLNLYQPRKLYSPEFLTQTKGQQVLIVGHSNTIPALVNQLIQEERFSDIDDTDNASLFIVSIQGEKTEVERKSIDLP